MTRKTDRTDEDASWVPNHDPPGRRSPLRWSGKSVNTLSSPEQRREVLDQMADAHRRNAGINLSPQELDAAVDVILALKRGTEHFEGAAQDGHAQLARSRIAYRRGGRDGAVAALGLTNPKNRGHSSPTGWDWKKTAGWFVRARTSVGPLMVPPPLDKFDEGLVVIQQRRSPEVLVGVVDCPVDEETATEMAAAIMGVTPRRAATELRPILLSRAQSQLVPPERRFRKA